MKRSVKQIFIQSLLSIQSLWIVNVGENEVKWRKFARLRGFLFDFVFFCEQPLQFQ